MRLTNMKRWSIGALFLALSVGLERRSVWRLRKQARNAASPSTEHRASAVTTC